ncbi:MAG: EamA family transporter RarD [Treponema sp.]|nr:EamA family transporter RarD [Treponema sp.]
MRAQAPGRGFLYAVSAYGLWGILPLYWKFLAAVSPLHILAFRILLSLALVGIILMAARNSAWLLVFRKPKTAVTLILTSLLLCCNWGLFIWAVNSGHTLQASLGYYINPLVSIILGLIFFRERLLPLQWAAVAIAFIGVLILTVLSGSLPLISLLLALTFSFYALLKKKLGLAALESLGAETLASAPVGILLLCFSFGGSGGGISGAAFAGLHSLAYFAELPLRTWMLLALAGLMTTLPLYFFALGAKLLPLSALGFAQFITPTINFVLALFVFGEAFPLRYFVAFGCIWTAVVIYIISLRLDRAGR